MSKKKKDEKIAVVLNGFDVCRIIPFKPAEGKYEVKVDFLRNDYQITCYKLFNSQPINVDLKDLHDTEITYHKGEKDHRVLIHVKRLTEYFDQLKYASLPIDRIQAPNINQQFPMPLLKLEIPLNVLERKYSTRDYHKVLSPSNANVIELYMVNSSFDLNHFEYKYSGLFMVYLMSSFEIFATNTVSSGNQKYSNILSNEDPSEIMTSFNLFDDVKIIAIYYKDRMLEKTCSKINITFIENELSEAILCNMKLKYPSKSTNGVFDYIDIGTSSLRDLQVPSFPLIKSLLGQDNIITDAIKRNVLTKPEQDFIVNHTLNLRKKLKDALIINDIV